MANITLLDTIVGRSLTTESQVIIEQFFLDNPLIPLLNVQNITGKEYRYIVEHKLPSAGYRRLNENFTKSKGEYTEKKQQLSILGGTVEIDRKLDTLNPGTLISTIASQTRSISGKFTRSAVKGDSLVSPGEFDGLQQMITGDRIFDAGNTNGGDPLSLIVLDECMSRVRGGNKVLAMGTKMWLRLSAASTDPNVGGYITRSVDQFGRPITFYNGTQIILLDEDHEDLNILDFDEPAPVGGQFQTTSIYCFSRDFDGLSIIQNGFIEAFPKGNSVGVMIEHDLEWFAAIVAQNPKKSARLRGILDVPVVR